MNTTQPSYVDSDNQFAATLIGFNDDLLTEILLRLPVRSIVRFKAVSKHWRSLLTHRRFTLLYDDKQKQLAPTGLFVRKSYIPFDDVQNPSTPPFHTLDHGLKIIQSCNGLLLCKGMSKPTPKYYVCNPTTMQTAVIPTIIGEPASDDSIFMGLAFHQTDCYHYKLVCLRNLIPKRARFQIQIYSSDTGKWRISRKSFTWHDDTGTLKSGVYCNGAIYWVASYFYILCFKLDVEQMQKLPLPKQLSWPLYFGESRGHLHFMRSYYHYTDLRLNVYEMLSDHSGWFIKYVVELDEVPRAYPELINPMRLYKFEVFDVVRGEEEEDTFMVVRIPEKVIRYNLQDRSFKEMFDLPNINPPYQGTENLHVHLYTKTIYSF